MLNQFEMWIDEEYLQVAVNENVIDGNKNIKDPDFFCSYRFSAENKSPHNIEDVKDAIAIIRKYINCHNGEPWTSVDYEAYDKVAKDFLSSRG